MKNSGQKIWKSLSLSYKISLIGSVILMGSLFLNWFSDVDVFRSGDTYTGLSGPLYFVGINMLMLAIANISVILGKTWKVGFLEKFSEISFGKYQLIAGFVVMYLLMIVNSVYFHSQFGLNLLSKKSEIGMFVAIMAAVMLCVGGYLSYRKKFEVLDTTLEKVEEEENENAQFPQINKVDPVVSPGAPQPERERPFPSGINEEKPALKPTEVPAQTKYSQLSRPVVNPFTENPVKSPPASFSSTIYEREARGKTDFERAKMYENLKKMMVKDTMSPEQRRKEREKQAKETAFSANFSKAEPIIAKPSANGISIEDLQRQGSFKKPIENDAAKAGEEVKKPQMYRMDL